MFRISGGHVDYRTRYARNALRHTVMPTLARAFPGYQERFARSVALTEEDRAGIEALIPHAGTMSLWDELLEASDAQVRLRTGSHRRADHPLRSRDRLNARVLVVSGPDLPLGLLTTSTFSSQARVSSVCARWAKLAAWWPRRRAGRDVGRADRGGDRGRDRRGRLPGRGRATTGARSGAGNRAFAQDFYQRCLIDDGATRGVDQIGGFFHQAQALFAPLHGTSLFMPVVGVQTHDLYNSWGASRDGGRRKHKGIDIFSWPFSSQT